MPSNSATSQRVKGSMQERERVRQQHIGTGNPCFLSKHTLPKSSSSPYPIPINPNYTPLPHLYLHFCCTSLSGQNPLPNGIKDRAEAILRVVVVAAIWHHISHNELPVTLNPKTTVWASHLSDELKRHFYKSWYRSKKKAFTCYAKKHAEDGGKSVARELERIRKNCTIVCVLAHTQIRKTGLSQKKAHLMEIQVNGGSIPDKVEFAHSLFEKPVEVSSVFEQNECVDVIAVTKGHDFEGVTHRWGTKKLPRKMHKGLRKVACIGAWYPSKVMFLVARAGQSTRLPPLYRKKLYRIGSGSDNANAMTESDVTKKQITPMGGFPHYGIVKNDFLILKGSIPGTKKRVVTIRKLLMYCRRSSILCYPMLVPLYYIAMPHARTLSWIAFLCTYNTAAT
ncbi:hypothetical protein BT96DRAFT_1043220 [Gymnopus androsaceus JB14]|uniref:Ribosomal protein L3 n=1 Tax=Gymnopus androsaceus JB14 TaxID=1447944 RepID=A0A6A4GBU9_9AGAR|nr:hypothetical protein BT96DRAFT_1043220 [Gymnopus androsaceus JB14]